MMIQNAIVLRTNDGLTLTSSTDQRNQDIIQEGQKKCLKLLSKSVKKLENKCYINLGPSNLYFIKNIDINTYIALADVRYPSTLAICFLKELQNEFSGKYDSRDVMKMRRPYSCIEFNDDIHKMIKRYNRPQSLTTKIDLQEINKELQNNPLRELKLSDLEPKPYFPNVNNVSIKMGDNLYLGVGPPAPIESLRWYHCILLLLCFLTALLSFYRCAEFTSTDENGEIWFLLKPRLRLHKYKMHLNFLSSLYTIFLIEEFSDIELTFLNMFIAISIHVATLTRSHVQKKPQALI